MNKIQQLNNKIYVDTETGEVLYPLKDITSTGKERPWTSKKIKNIQLANIYYDLAEHNDDHFYKKADRLVDCGNILTFNINEDGTKSLVNANSCHVKLCPTCAWRRELKIHAQTTAIFNELVKNPNLCFLFLTLTVPNCTGVSLSSTLDLLSRSWDKMTRRKFWRGRILGAIKIVEVTHNINKNSKSYNTYHPHIHALLVVDKSYFSKYKDNYITQAQWLDYWRQATGVNSISQINIKRVKPTDGNLTHALAEVSKYSVKDVDYIIPSDWQLSKETVAILDTALRKRKLISFSGIIKDIHKQLNLDDPEDGDLVHIDENALSESAADNLVSYFWHYGYQQYFMI